MPHPSAERAPAAYPMARETMRHSDVPLYAFQGRQNDPCTLNAELMHLHQPAPNPVCSLRCVSGRECFVKILLAYYAWAPYLPWLPCRIVFTNAGTCGRKTDPAQLRVNNTVTRWVSLVNTSFKDKKQLHIMSKYGPTLSLDRTRPSCSDHACLKPHFAPWIMKNSTWSCLIGGNLASAIGPIQHADPADASLSHRFPTPR
jgi:hypothetical protein